MKVIFTKQEMIDGLRAQYNLDESVAIEIIDSDTTGADYTADWIAVPKDWVYEESPTFGQLNKKALELVEAKLDSYIEEMAQPEPNSLTK